MPPDADVCPCSAAAAAAALLMPPPSHFAGPAEARHNSTAMEAEAAPAFDFSHLPTDALHVVFEHVFAPTDPQRQPALPLSLFWERWAACSAVCKTWRDVSVAACMVYLPADAQVLRGCCRCVAIVSWAPKHGAQRTEASRKPV